MLTPSETEHFFDVLRTLKKEGYAVIIITHRMSEIMSISDRVTILRDGKKVKDLVTAKTNPEELSYFMIGRQLGGGYEDRKPAVKDNALVLKDVTIKKSRKTPQLDHIDLEVRKGEILGIAGVDGNGQKELAEVIAGIRKPTSGTLEFMGGDITSDKVKARFKKGISYISDDRHADGLVLDMSLADNMILRQYDEYPYSKAGFFNKRWIKDLSMDAIKDYRIKTSGKSTSDTIVKLMSGGNQQKIILAREITDKANLIIANQPTRGLDIGATEFVRKALMEQRNLGKSVLLISADLEEIMQLSDRVAVMFSGKIMGILEHDDITLQKLGLLMGGIAKEEEQP